MKYHKILLFFFTYVFLTNFMSASYVSDMEDEISPI